MKIRTWWQAWEKYPQINWGLSVLWLFLIGSIAFLWHLGSTGLVDETEPLFAEAARQMTVTGDWITPYFNGETRFDKPPLIYWLMAIGYHLIGVNEWAVRLPSALAAIAIMILGFWTLHHYGFATPNAAHNSETQRSHRQLWLSALLGSALIAFNPETLIWGRTGVSDMLLSACLGMALLCFFLGYAQDTTSPPQPNWFRPQNQWYWAFYIFLALAVLAKGPVGVVLPGLIILSFLFYVGQFRAVLQEIGVVTGGLIFLLLTLPWYILVILKHGQTYINAFFGYHNLERFTGVVNQHSAPWYFYFLVVLVGFAPWSIYLPQAMIHLRFWQQQKWSQQPRKAQLGLFACFWFICIFIFFTIAATKLPSYILPLLPAAAILVALLWSAEITREKPDDNQQKLGFLISGTINVFFLIILAGVLFFLPQILGSDPAAPNLREVLAQSGINLRSAIIWGTTALLLAGFLRWRKFWRWIPLANLIGFMAFSLFALTPAFFLVDQMRQLPLRELAAIITEVKQPQEEVMMIGFKKPSLVFYTQKPVKFVHNGRRAIAYLETTSAPSVLIISRPKHQKRLSIYDRDLQVLATKGPYELLRLYLSPKS